MTKRLSDQAIQLGLTTPWSVQDWQTALDALGPYASYPPIIGLVTDFGGPRVGVPYVLTLLPPREITLESQ